MARPPVRSIILETVDNPLAKARGLSLRTGGQTMLYRSHENKTSNHHPYTVELQWLEHLWDYENLFETRVVRAIEGLL